MKQVIIFASGTGSNAVKIIERSQNSTVFKVSAVFSNKKEAVVLEKADSMGVPTVVFTREELETGGVEHTITQFSPDLIVLAGFLLKLPEGIIRNYQDKIINIHPSLLPKYGGKGMYGMNVHRAVWENEEKETGITIHYVNEHYDEGAILFQYRVDISKCSSPESIAEKVLELEHQHYPEVIEDILNS